MGSVASALCGARQPGMPAYSAAPHLKGGTDNLFHYATYLGGAHNPLVTNSDPNGKVFGVADLSLRSGLTFDRLNDRRSLLKTIDQYRRRADGGMVDMSDQQQSAFNLLTGSVVREAYDITQEPDALRDNYGRHTFGQSALLARRLVECGVTFVTVNTQPWDHHGTANRLPTEKGAKQLIPPGDRGVDPRSGGTRSVREDARRRDGRIRPHPEDERRSRSRSLGPHIQRDDERRQVSHGTGDWRIRCSRCLRCRATAQPRRRNGDGLSPSWARRSQHGCP